MVNSFRGFMKFRMTGTFQKPNMITAIATIWIIQRGLMECRVMSWQISYHIQHHHLAAEQPDWMSKNENIGTKRQTHLVARRLQRALYSSWYTGHRRSNRWSCDGSHDFKGLTAHGTEGCGCDTVWMCLVRPGSGEARFAWYIRSNWGLTRVFYSCRWRIASFASSILA